MRFDRLVHSKPAATRAIEQRLRSGAANATISPRPSLRRRTITAIEGAAPGGHRLPRPARPFSLAPAYAVAFGVLILFSATAAVVHRRPPSSPTDAAHATQLARASALAGAPARTPRTTSSGALPVVIGIDTTKLDATLRERTRRLGASLESPLFREARSILDDAINAAGLLLASLPMDTVRIERTHAPTDGSPVRPEEGVASD